jgi:para-nitrobenzyl esterase
MSDMLLAYARTGDPNTPSLPHWPRYELPARATMLFDNTCTIANDPRGDERRLISLIPHRQPGT